MRKVVITLCLAAALGGCSSSPTAPPTATVETGRPPTSETPIASLTLATAKVGETLTVRGAALGTANEVRYTLKSIKQHTVSPEGDWKPEHGIWLAADVDVTVQKGQTYACSCAFALIAKDGTVYEAVAGIGFKGNLEGADLNPGQRKSGLVVFDVPPATLAGARIELRDGAGGKPIGYWSL